MKQGKKTELLFGITGASILEISHKLKELKRRKISKAGLFLTRLNKECRKKTYKLLEYSSIKSIPLVHIRNDMTLDELKYLNDTFKVQFFTIHVNGLNYLPKWKGFHKKLYLEFCMNSSVPSASSIRAIGGFCIDLAHYKRSERIRSGDYYFVNRLKNDKGLFACNHISGYSYRENRDLHNAGSSTDFEYLKEIPEFLLGKVAALEVNNTIREQVRFAKQICNYL